MAPPAKKRKTHDLKSSGVRVPSAIHKALTREAERNRRSLNAEIILRLEASLRGEKQLDVTA